MSGECNYCGGLHAEEACDADRGLVHDNGYASGEAVGMNHGQPLRDALKKENADLHRELTALKSLAAEVAGELREHGYDTGRDGLNPGQCDDFADRLSPRKEKA